VLVPAVAVRDGDGVFLDDLAPADLARDLGVPVRVVEPTPGALLKAIRDTRRSGGMIREVAPLSGHPRCMPAPLLVTIDRSRFTLHERSGVRSRVASFSGHPRLEPDSRHSLQ
jgi:hypothetical protein